MEAKVLKRIYKEIEDVNDDFFNLRTVVKPDPGDDVTRFPFIMLPNDGAMAHLPLVGALYIPETYPTSPPIVHLYTRTGRYNVDVYHHNATGNNRGLSSLCFNILRAESPGGYGSGTWTQACTLSALFATLMSAIVSLYVPQEGGGRRAEFVSIEGLRRVKEQVRKSFEEHKKTLPPVPQIPLVAATRVPAEELAFPAEIATGVYAGRGQQYGNMGSPGHDQKVTAGPIYLQTGDPKAVYTFAVDLCDLHENVVFSIVLSNCLNDLTGRKSDTILVRNGVTATAARKCADKPTQWFYHGKPMNDGNMRLHVTIGQDQMTMAYYSEDGRRCVFGDCPVSWLTAKELGDVRGVPFWVHIFTSNKSETPAKIYTLDTGGYGYIFRDAEDREFEFVDGADEEVPPKRKEVQQDDDKVDAGNPKTDKGSVDVDSLLAMFRAADVSSKPAK
ncbi:uncharacterized protein B0I36DRAFT_338247 [Microdochium trichocladiopsis]|uniref:UBC core domain-containing protein n=1 Tax=Microdochium trichocladiopsis TaxID=1682393 RepID=A0A9P9BI63_9PEZI|nr:uncharacterized protein B0I36DRAFT_338247 [Microdochium trichocladiopsis]KAH7014088.1 hypothetical protein B0I36DRAFT_338247 [Microdochium trichocladiopsis]